MHSPLPVLHEEEEGRWPRRSKPTRLRIHDGIVNDISHQRGLTSHLEDSHEDSSVINIIGLVTKIPHQQRKSQSWRAAALCTFGHAGFWKSSPDGIHDKTPVPFKHTQIEALYLHQPIPSFRLKSMCIATQRRRHNITLF